MTGKNDQKIRGRDVADRLTDEERALIDAAMRERPEEAPERVPQRRRTRAELPELLYRPEISRTLPPVRPAGTRALPVRELLEWAFRDERAAFEADEIGASSGAQRQGVSMEHILEQRFMLGGVAIDTSPGTSSPHEDAEVVASVVRAALPWPDAVWVADLARAGREPV